MQPEFDRARAAARRAYELGRARVAALRASVAVVALGAIAMWTIGRGALVWLPVTFAVAALADWRGLDAGRGARRGLVVGAASLALPIWILRPCCAPGMESADCCAPGACVLAGAAVGLCAAVLLPRAHGQRRWEAIVAMAGSVIAVAVMRCAPLFLGESLGLLGGIAVGLAASSVGRTWLDQHGHA